MRELAVIGDHALDRRLIGEGPGVVRGVLKTFFLFCYRLIIGLWSNVPEQHAYLSVARLFCCFFCSLHQRADHGAEGRNHYVLLLIFCEKPLL